MIVTGKSDKNELVKSLMFAKIIIHEKFEARFITIYYKATMMFIIEFLNEAETDRYIKKLTALVLFYTGKPYELKPYF